MLTSMHWWRQTRRLLPVQTSAIRRAFTLCTQWKCSATRRVLFACSVPIKCHSIGQCARAWIYQRFLTIIFPKHALPSHHRRLNCSDVLSLETATHLNGTRHGSTSRSAFWIRWRIEWRWSAISPIPSVCQAAIVFAISLAISDIWA